MISTKEEENLIKCSESIDKNNTEAKTNYCQLEDYESKRKKEEIKFHNWFLIHSGMQKDIKSRKEESLLSTNSQIDDTSSKTKEREEEKEERDNLYEKYFYRICDYKPLETKKDYYDYEAWFKNHSASLEEEKEDNFSVYTSICKKYYPCFIKPAQKTEKNGFDKHFKNFSFFCFTCERHFSTECKTDHSEHSFINLDQLKINEEDLIKEEKSVKNKISSLFKRFLDNKEYENSYEAIKKTEDEIIKFNIFVINSYRKEKNINK